jgi:hypothetical protein
MIINFGQYEDFLIQKKLANNQINIFNQCIEAEKQPSAFMIQQKLESEEFLRIMETAIFQHHNQTVLINEKEIC